MFTVEWLSLFCFEIVMDSLPCTVLSCFVLLSQNIFEFSDKEREREREREQEQERERDEKVNQEIEKENKRNL